MNSPTPIILCGGFGVRLWPMSRREHPKQFVPLVEGESSLEHALRRGASLGSARAICVANEAHRRLLEASIEAAGTSADILLEPFPRNTAPALAAAAVFLAERDPEAILLSMPADHWIPDATGFAATIAQGMAAAVAGWVVTFGVRADSPSPDYGYIDAGAPLPSGLAGRRVNRFVEKPDTAGATELVAAGNLWNAGIFLMRADVLLDALARHAPEVLSCARRAVRGRRTEGRVTRLDADAFLDCPSISIDHAVLERHEKTAVIDLPHAWSDLGSWDGLAVVDGLGDADAPDVRLADCRNVVVRGGERLTVAVGLDDVVIVDTPDALLVTALGAADPLKRVVAGLEAEGRAEVARHRNAEWPWGSSAEVCSDGRFQVCRLLVKPGARLPERCHLRQTTHWIVTEGACLLTCGGRDRSLGRTESVVIPAGIRHHLHNPGPETLQIIEIRLQGADEAHIARRGTKSVPCPGSSGSDPLCR